MPGMARPDIPRWKDLLWPTLDALRALGGSGSIEEIETTVDAIVGFTEEQQAVLHKSGPLSEINYRLAWVRTYLKGVGYVENSSRGVWSWTESGRDARPADMETVEARYRALHKRTPQSEPGEIASPDEPEETASSWRDDLLKRLLALPPERFEHLAKRLLREAGFTQVEVTGRSGDEGIDGTGIYRPTLVSFPVFFQCKRYKGSVGPSKVRDFRGAMSGRGDQGILITTGTFTSDAKAEASRAGAPLIDLIDGEGLCALLKQYQLGVRTKERLVEEVEVLPDFFDQV
jgi:restriction system protein